jgi:PIN domain nuclease of toxin-antitoxin system
MILLDTHVLVWAADGPDRLSRTAASEIRRARRDGGLAISAMSLWELAFLLTRGRIQMCGSVESSIRLLTEDVTVIPITPEIAVLAALFPDDYPGDHADRLIGATARAEGLTLITHDKRIRKSPLIKTAW